jgi:hypothetical protein
MSLGLIGLDSISHHKNAIALLNGIQLQGSDPESSMHYDLGVPAANARALYAFIPWLQINI